MKRILFIGMLGLSALTSGYAQQGEGVHKGRIVREPLVHDPVMAKEGDTYYHISANFGVLPSVWYNDEPSNLRRNLGTVFLTEKEAEMEICREVCETIMMKYGRRTFKHEKSNFLINYNSLNKMIFADSYSFTPFQGSIYFDTKELAQKAIDEIGEERLKKYVFRVEE